MWQQNVFGRSGQETQTIKAWSLWVTENLSDSEHTTLRDLLCFDYPYIHTEYIPPVNIQNKALPPRAFGK